MPSIDIVTAAGSLNYADLDLFFPEAERVLRPSGVLLVYDFSQGKSFRASSLLDGWHAKSFAIIQRLLVIPARSSARKSWLPAIPVFV